MVSVPLPTARTARGSSGSPRASLTSARLKARTIRALRPISTALSAILCSEMPRSMSTMADSGSVLHTIMNAFGSVPAAGRCSSGRYPPRRRKRQKSSPPPWASRSLKRKVWALRPEGSLGLTATMVSSWRIATVYDVSKALWLRFFFRRVSNEGLFLRTTVRPPDRRASSRLSR